MFLLLGCLTAVPAAAADRLLTIDPTASAVSFRLKATGHAVDGVLPPPVGHLRFDTETGAAGGEIRVDASGADTDNKKRDKTMHRKVLESDEYPLIVFRPQAIAGTLVEGAVSTLELAGTMSIHGAEHALRMTADAELRDGLVSATTTFPIPFVEWGMKDPSWLFLRVAKEVQVTVKIEGRLTGAAHAAPAR